MNPIDTFGLEDLVADCKDLVDYKDVERGVDSDGEGQSQNHTAGIGPQRLFDEIF